MYHRQKCTQDSVFMHVLGFSNSFHNVRLERSEDLIEGHPANEIVSFIFQRLCDWSTDTCMYKLNYDLLYTG